MSWPQNCPACALPVPNDDEESARFALHLREVANLNRRLADKIQRLADLRLELDLLKNQKDHAFRQLAAQKEVEVALRATAAKLSSKVEMEILVARVRDETRAFTRDQCRRALRREILGDFEDAVRSSAPEHGFQIVAAALAAIDRAVPEEP